MKHDSLHKLAQRMLGAALCMAAAAALCGCSGIQPTSVLGDSGWVTQRGAQLSMNLTRKHPHPASEPHSGYALEANYQHMKSGNGQTLSTGQQPVVFGGTTFVSPVQLRNTFDFTYFALGLRRREFFPNAPLGLEWNMGMSGANLDVTVASPTQQATRNYGGGMLHLGLGAIVRINPASSVHLHGISDLSLSMAVQEWELYYAWAFHRNAALQLGYADWSLQNVERANESRIDLNVAGPMVRLQVSFNGDSRPQQAGQFVPPAGRPGHFSGSGWPLVQPVQDASSVPATSPLVPEDGAPQ